VWRRGLAGTEASIIRDHGCGCSEVPISGQGFPEAVAAYLKSKAKTGCPGNERDQHKLRAGPFRVGTGEPRKHRGVRVSTPCAFGGGAGIVPTNRHPCPRRAGLCLDLGAQAMKRKNGPVSGPLTLKKTRSPNQSKSASARGLSPFVQITPFTSNPTRHSHLPLRYTLVATTSSSKESKQTPRPM